jgi:hypothetical protein
MSWPVWTVTFRCAKGHSQELRYAEGFCEDMVHDHAVLIAGGTLRSLGTKMPGYQCAWAVDDSEKPCGADISFSVRRDA